MKANGSSKAAALDLARRGFAVFPIKARDKAPATEHGFKDGNTDPAVVEKLFAKRSGSNIGIATGPVSRVWVLDVEAEGIEDLDQLQERYGKLPKTVVAITGGGGRHYYFSDSGTGIKNRTKIGGLAIDVRGEGGYVVAPPSTHASGRRYEWEHDPDSTPIVEAPQWLVDLVVEKNAAGGNGKAAALTFTVGGGAVENLAAAPGAGQGERHDRALKLIGGAIGRGLDLCEVARQAVEWGRRCTPSMDEDEILKIVSDLSQKQGTKVETARVEVEAAPMPQAVPWPVLDQAAYHGIAGEIVRLIEPETESDPVAILVQFLVSAGNMIGRGPYYMVEGTSHHANLFAVLVGKTARGRKGTSEGRCRQVLAEVDEEWTTGNIKTGLVSGEGLIWAVRDPIYKTENVKEKGRVVRTETVLADPGIEDKRLLVVEPEFAAILRVCRREQNTLSATLRSAWDSGLLKTLAKNSPATATDAHVSIISHITHEELSRALAEVEGFNGFANRFLWVAVRRSKLLPDGGRDLDLAPYARRLSTAVSTARSIGRMKRDEAAAALWRKVYAELADDDSQGLLAAVTSRAEAQVLRLGMIYALLDGSGTVTAEHLTAALAIWRYCRSSARLIFGDASGDPLLDKVLVTIRQHPDGISRWDLHSSLCKHKPAAALVQILARLRDDGRIETRTLSTAGRDAETWFPVAGTGEKGGKGGNVQSPGGGLTSHTSLISQAQAGMKEIRI